MINNLSLYKLAFLVIFVGNLYHQVVTVPIECGLESNCTITDNSEVCILDHQENCIRKYASKCHMEIAACIQGRQKIADYSQLYCAMEPYLCEEGYEHWTIFFGHEKN